MFTLSSCVCGYHVYRDMQNASVHIPRTISCACTLFLMRGGAIQSIAIATGPRKYSYDLLQGLRVREFPCMYRFMILLTLCSQNQWLTVTCYLAKNLVRYMFCSHVATLTHEKRENLGPAICENIIARILLTCCLAKISYHENFCIYSNPIFRQLKYFIKCTI